MHKAREGAPSAVSNMQRISSQYILCYALCNKFRVPSRRTLINNDLLISATDGLNKCDDESLEANSDTNLSIL